MEEIIAAAITTIDIFVIYLLLRMKKGRMRFVLWTTFLNIMIPLIGYTIGYVSIVIFAEWTALFSGLLLVLIGVHMLFAQNDASQMKQIPPALLALMVSFDALSVSITFGMLQFNAYRFILASGVFSFVFSILALYVQQQLFFLKKYNLTGLAGIVLIILGLLSWFQ